MQEYEARVLKHRVDPSEEEPRHKPLYIIKPNKLSRGRGIYLVDSHEQIKIKDDDGCIVSDYVDNPMTLKGHKYDLRIYVFVTSFDPLRVYVYNEGMARLATEKYDAASPIEN